MFDARVLLVVMTMSGAGDEQETDYPMPDMQTCLERIKYYRLSPEERAFCEDRKDYWKNPDATADRLRYTYRMEPAEIIEICREAVYVLILISAPIMLVALAVGVTISLLQALTQVQEATLTFVPKVLAMLLMLSLTLPFMIDRLTDFTNKLQDKIVHIE